MLPAFLRPLLAPLLTPLITALLGYLAVHFHVVYDPDQTKAITENGIEAIIWIFSLLATASGILKVLINKKINPGNAASAHLADSEKKEVAIIKQTAEMPVYKARVNPGAEE